MPHDGRRVTRQKLLDAALAPSNQRLRGRLRGCPGRLRRRPVYNSVFFNRSLRSTVYN